MQFIDKLIIADDHPLFRQALANVIDARFQDVSIFEADGIDTLDAVLSSHPDAELLLLDLNIPNAHGLNTLIRIRSEHPNLAVVVVSGQEDTKTISQAMRCGASGFIPKSKPVPQMMEAIEAVASGGQWLPQGMELECEAEDDMADRIARLSPRQHRILLMFADGLLNKQIAAELGLSEATVKAHASALFLKLGVRTRTQAVIAMQQLQTSRTVVEI
ncbi:response regulator [Ferrimonas aestuarii]|uniref:Response regulator transcription factor n=1 Tax=Ferrimonas aestuarii TaxID=2569539 RepID=A0A4V5NWL7_9GAMM|nr:response regulator transcription factor [Ferrimonas aestuarii]TKB58648.1 response regulator transcription factor [Ferrimonas aestuarii]